jgi:putative tryptophan/tyrosine transport system substrate-binding protein
MLRREFLGVMGGAAATWPLRARAQQPERMRRIGVLMTVSENDPEGQARLDAMRQGLNQLGWTEGNRIPLGGRRYRAPSGVHG